jgi:mannose-6-phosphate isomerase-like protein (cupin superfamily)
MKKISIQDLTPDLVSGIQVQLPGTEAIEEELYFKWAPSTLVTQFDTNFVSGGILTSSKADPIFYEIESHLDAEMFYFMSGTAIMIFIDLLDQKPLMDTAQIVRIQPGTQLIIPAGKAHFVPVPEGDDALEIIVVAPKMGDIKVDLPESVMGI